VGNARNIAGNGAEGSADGDLYARMIRRTRLALERGNTLLRGVLWRAQTPWLLFASSRALPGR